MLYNFVKIFHRNSNINIQNKSRTYHGMNLETQQKDLSLILVTKFQNFTFSALSFGYSELDENYA